MASFIRTASAPVTPRSSAVIVLPWLLLATTIRPIRSFISARSLVRASIAISSLATEISNWVCGVRVNGDWCSTHPPLRYLLIELPRSACESSFYSFHGNRALCYSVWYKPYQIFLHCTTIFQIPYIAGNFRGTKYLWFSNIETFRG